MEYRWEIQGLFLDSSTIRRLLNTYVIFLLGLLFNRFSIALEDPPDLPTQLRLLLLNVRLLDLLELLDGILEVLSLTKFHLKFRFELIDRDFKNIFAVDLLFFELLDIISEVVMLKPDTDLFRCPMAYVPACFDKPR